MTKCLSCENDIQSSLATQEVFTFKLKENQHAAQICPRLFMFSNERFILRLSRVNTFQFIVHVV